MATRPILYLAAPYSHPDRRVIAERMRLFCYTAVELEKAETYHVVSGLYNHLLLQYSDLPGDWTFWGSYSETLLRKADQLAVLTLDGWQTSTGVQEEIRIATEHVIPIQYLDPLSLRPQLAKLCGLLACFASLSFVTSVILWF